MRLGRSLRALRIRRGLRQVDVATRVRLSRGTVSNVERGRLAGVSLRVLDRVASELGADIDVRIRWRGEQLDRLLDEGHAQLVESFVRFLGRSGWETAVEVTFSIRGERGAIDILAFHPMTKALLVVEIKTVVPDAHATLSILDRKTRLAATIARDRGWHPTSVSRVVVIEEGSTSRGRVERLGATLNAAFPDRGARVRRWLRAPTDTISGLVFFRSATGAGATHGAAGRQRVRRPRSRRNATATGVSEGRDRPDGSADA